MVFWKDGAVRAKWVCLLATVLLALALPGAGEGVVFYVNAENTKGPWDGRSWATAFASLQEAIDAAFAAGGGEVWVAKGVYKPTSGGERSASFVLKPGVRVYGGFAGGERTRAQRDPGANATILSGDIGRPGDPSDNCYHVLVGADDALLDGFVIANGNANGTGYDGKGGGMVNYRRGFVLQRTGRPRRGPSAREEQHAGFSPAIINCTFSNNFAREGGAIYNYDDACPTMANCTFSANRAQSGGAIVNRDGSNAAIRRCTFASNHATLRGGAIFNDYGSSPEIEQCVFRNNTSDGYGGAIYTDDAASQIGHTSPRIAGCRFENNRARLRGGAVANFNKCTPSIVSCTFSGNFAGQGGGAISNDYHVRAEIVGCAFENNSAGAGESDVSCDETSAVLSRLP